MSVWQKTKDILLLILGLALLPVVLILSVPGWAARLAGWLVRRQRRGVDETGGDHDDTGESLEAAGEAIENAIGTVEGSRSGNEQSLALNGEAQDILRGIRERKRNQTGG